MKRSASGVWELRLSSSPYTNKIGVTYVPLRVTQENHTVLQSLANGLHTLDTEQSRVTSAEGSHQQVDRLQAQFTSRCHSHCGRVGTDWVFSNKTDLHQGHQTEHNSTCAH